MYLLKKDENQEYNKEIDESQNRKNILLNQ